MDQLEVNDALRDYEITFLSKGGDGTPVKRLLEKHGAVITLVKDFKKINLATPIRKEQMAHLSFFGFKIDRTAISQLFTDLKLEGDVLRFMIQRVARPQEARGRVKPVRQASREINKESVRSFNEPILTNEAIQEKIEEILK